MNGKRSVLHITAIHSCNTRAAVFTSITSTAPHRCTCSGAIRRERGSFVVCVLVLALARFPSNMFRRSRDTFVPEGLPLVLFSQIDPPVPDVERTPGLKGKMFLLASWPFLMPLTPRLQLNIHTLLLCNSAEFCLAWGINQIVQYFITETMKTLLNKLSSVFIFDPF